MRTRLVLGATTFALAAVIAGPAAAQGTAPVTQDDFATLDEDTIVVVYPLLNDSDPQGGSLELVEVTPTTTGDTRIDGPAVVFTPIADFNGPATLTYTVRSEGGESTGKILLTVTPINDAPQATADAADVTSGIAANINVVANDLDVDNEALELVSVANPGNGTANVSGPFVVYTANDGFAGVDVVTYVVADPAGATAQGTLTIQVALPPPPSTTSPPPSSTTAAPSSTTAAPTTTTAAPTTTVVTTTVAPPTTVPAEATVGSTLVAGPQWVPPASSPTIGPGDGNPEGFLTALRRNLNDLYLPLLTLLVVGVAAWLLSQQGRSPLRKRAVVLVGRSESLPVYDKPSTTAAVIHRFEYSERQIEVVGRRRESGGISWLPVATPAGDGWAMAKYLTEDVARASFERDLSERDIVRELRRRLKQGGTVATSPRGMIDPETFHREPGRRQLGGHATNKLAALIGDWRASFHIDTTASMAALRPPQLRNLHWVSFEAPGLEPWKLFFEYHDGEPYPVAALQETAPVEV